MTARETIEAELKQMVFDLLHEQDMDDLRDGEKKALAHISAAEQAHILWTAPSPPPGGMRSKRRPRSAAF